MDLIGQLRRGVIGRQLLSRDVIVIGYEDS